MKTLSLISLGIGGVGTVAGTGVALNYYYGGSTIKEYIVANKKENNKVFFTSSTAKLDDIKAKYKDSKRTKPKNKEGNYISENEIDKWCEKAVNDKFSKEEDKDFEGILSWCYINTNSFEEELRGHGKSKINSTSHTEKVWQDAWTKYSTTKDASNLKITGHNKDSDLNGSNNEKGQEALMNWCKEKATLGMYVDKAKEDFDRFAHWCTTN